MIEANCLELPDQIQENAARLTCLLTIKALKYSLSHIPAQEDKTVGEEGQVLHHLKVVVGSEYQVSELEGIGISEGWGGRW